MSDTQGSSVGRFFWFRGKGQGRPETEPSPLAVTKVTLRLAVTCLEFVPIPNLDQIPSLLLKCIEIYGRMESNEENLKELLDTIQKAQDSIFRPLELVSGVIPDETKTIIERFHSDVNRQHEIIRSLQPHSRAWRLFAVDDRAEHINKLRTYSRGAISDFTAAGMTMNFIQGVRSSMNHDLSKLQKAEAEHTAVKSKSECLQNTRNGIQKSIVNHLLGSKDRFVWLKGSLGMGKTAISMSVASNLEERGVLAASFFWDKNRGSGLNSLDWFPSTLARQLAKFSREYEAALVRHLRKPSLSNVEGFSPEKQMKALLLEPMVELKELWSVKKRAVIVLDGLDECGDLDELKKLMKLVLILDELPSTFGVLISCRPEPQVASAWKKASGIRTVNINALPEDDHFQTVRSIVEDGLKESVEGSWTPSEKEYDAFARACRNLPVLAKIRVRNVCSLAEHGSTLKKEFLRLTDESAPQDLETEYLRILRRAFRPEGIEIPQYVFSHYQQVVGTIVAVRREVSIDTMSHILGITPDDIRGTLKPISSIIDLPSKDTEDVKFYHATVKEFIISKPRDPKDKVFFIEDMKGYFLGLYLLKLLNNALKQLDMHTDPPLGDRNKEPWKRPHVRYAAQYLFYHLDPSQLSSMSGELRSEFDFLLNGKVLPFLLLCGDSWTSFSDESARVLQDMWSGARLNRGQIIAGSDLFD